MTDDKPASPASPMSASSAISTEDEAIVAAYGTVLEAELARGRLESEGLACRIVDGNTVGMAQHLSMALGGVKIAVARNDFEAAQAILSAAPLPDDDDDERERAREEAKKAEFTADMLANRALRASILGLVIVPPVGHLWSAALLADVVKKRAELTPKGKRQATIAAVIDAGAIGTAAWLLVQMFG